MWCYGDQIVLRSWAVGQLSWVLPVTVVEDPAECIAVYLAHKTPTRLPVQLDGAPIPRSLPYEERFAIPKRIGEGVWHSTSQLWLARPGAAHTFGVFWDGDDAAFLGWYVHFLAPLKRTSLGFDSEDYDLDVVIEPDLSWRMKDEDDFAAAQRLGRFSPQEVAAIRAKAETVINAIEAGAWPFNAGWEKWTPDPAWPIPEIRSGWDCQLGWESSQT